MRFTRNSAAPMLTLAAVFTCMYGSPALAQTTPEAHAEKRSTQRLWLRDGSFQVVTEYHLAGSKVRFYSAERAGWEELPLELIDLQKTQTWNREHAALPPPPKPLEDAPPEQLVTTDPQRPVAAPHLLLDPAAYLLALDSFRNADELTPMRQQGSAPEPVAPPKPKKIKSGEAPPPPPPPAVRPLVQAMPMTQSAHKADGKSEIRLRGTLSPTALHVGDPTFFVRNPAATRWAVVRVRVDVNHRDRVVTPVTAQTLTGVGANALAVTSAPVAGGVWTKLTLAGKLPIGEYALVQVLPDGRFDEHVWDFSVDPTADENGDAIRADNAPRR